MSFEITSPVYSGSAIINVIPFFGEFELLKFRLETLKNVVDTFVISEAETTFSGQCKPLFFKEARDYGWDFSAYNIVPVTVTDSPYGNDPWPRENYQRTQVNSLIPKLNPKLVLMTDADEIPCPSAIQHCLSSHSGKFTFHMDMLKFYINFKDPRIHWNKVMAYKPTGFQTVLFDREEKTGSEHVYGSGWHFEYMGGRDRLLYKIGAISHFNETGGRSFWREIYEGTHDWSYCEPYDTIKLPREIDFLNDNPTFFWREGQDWVRTRRPLSQYLTSHEGRLPV